MNTLRFVLSAAFAAFIVAGCGGGTGGTGVTSGGPTNAVSIGVMTKGSVIVNGVHFDDSGANIRVEDRPGTTADLQNGKHVKVRGQINDDRVTGAAQQVAVQPEVRGPVQTTNAGAVPPSFTVIGQTVVVDDLTVFANFTPVPVSPSAAVGALSPGNVVEVHGLRDSAGIIHASRVEKLAANPFFDELRGTVGASPTSTTFNLQNGSTTVAVDYTGATISPTGTALTAGMTVEVHGTFNGTTTFNATKVDVEDLEDAQFQPGANDDLQVEGLIAGFTAHPGTFTINGQTVQTTANTRFENGSAADLANNVNIEAEGHLSGGVLVADKIEFERTQVILTGTASVTGTIPGSGTLSVFGKTVQITSLTEINQTGGITNGEQVEVRGFVDSGGTIVAERIDDNPSGGGKDIVQARVTAKNSNVLTFGDVGINADLTGALQLFDANEQPVASLAAFLAMITPASGNTTGTLVKVKGQFSSGTISSVEEAELEN